VLSDGPYTVLLVFIAVLLFSETTVAKLAADGVTAEEVRQVAEGDRVVIRNPRPRVGGSVLMIGPTHGGRLLTVVLNPEPPILEPGTCAPRGRRAPPSADATSATANRVMM
jgi:hypothetical protein